MLSEALPTDAQRQPDVQAPSKRCPAATENGGTKSKKSPMITSVAAAVGGVSAIYFTKEVIYVRVERTSPWIKEVVAQTSIHKRVHGRTFCGHKTALQESWSGPI